MPRFMFICNNIGADNGSNNNCYGYTMRKHPDFGASVFDQPSIVKVLSLDSTFKTEYGVYRGES